MTKEKVEFVCALLLLAWALYKYIKDRRKKYLYGLVLFMGTMLWLYPLYLPLEAGLSVWSALAAWIVLQEAWRQGRESPLRLAGLILVGFTIVFLIKTLFEIKLL